MAGLPVVRGVRENPDMKRRIPAPVSTGSTTSYSKIPAACVNST